MSETVAFIGGGNMAEAIARGLIAAGHDPRQLRIGEVVEPRRAHLRDTLGVSVFAETAEATEGADTVLLAVKPPDVDEALAPAAWASAPLLISIVAGVTLEKLRAAVPKRVRLVRAMPNTPALVGRGITALALGATTEARDEARATAIFDTVGSTVVVQERDMDAVTGLSGSGPAYIFVAIEALADGGVAAGLPRPVAHRLAVQTVAGAAALAAAGDHPAALKDRVMSPGGTTAAGVRALEAHGFRSALIEAVHAATRRSAGLGETDPDK